MARERTYKQIQADILGGLEAMGWDTKPRLKVPHATDPSRRLRLWFRPQSVHYDIDNRGRGNFAASSARSLFVDLKRLDTISSARDVPPAAVLAGWASSTLVASGELRAPVFEPPHPQWLSRV